jgi:hypothetical protein
MQSKNYQRGSKKMKKYDYLSSKNLMHGEILWETTYSQSGTPNYIITSNLDRSIYYIYKVLKTGELQKLGKGKTPPECFRRYAR